MPCCVAAGASSPSLNTPSIITRHTASPHNLNPSLSRRAYILYLTFKSVAVDGTLPAVWQARFLAFYLTNQQRTTHTQHPSFPPFSGSRTAFKTSTDGRCARSRPRCARHRALPCHGHCHASSIQNMDIVGNSGCCAGSHHHPCTHSPSAAISSTDTGVEPRHPLVCLVRQ